MNQSSTEQLKKTPLNARHRAHGARMVPFGGWDMPVEYSGIVNEHLAVRTKAGLFDVSHMGEIELAGKDALAAVQKISTNDAGKTERRAGAVFGADDAGGNVRRRPSRVSPCERSLPARGERRQHRESVQVDRRARAARRRRRRRQLELAVCTARRAGTGGSRNRSAAHDRRPCTSSSTTGSRTAKWPACAASFPGPVTPGEDGFELFIPPASAERVWNAILERAPKPGSCRSAWAHAIRCGSRQACICPVRTSTKRRPCSKPIWGGSSAGRRTTSSARPRSSSRRAPGLTRKLVGFEMTAPGIARHGYTAYAPAAMVS